MHGKQGAHRVPLDKISEFCKKRHIRRLALFGSVLSDRFGKKRNIDVLVEFELGQVVGLLRMAGMERELSDLFGRPIYLRSPSDMSRYFRDEVLASADVQNAEG